jgi:molybdopterin molybdotransferase
MMLSSSDALGTILDSVERFPVELLSTESCCGMVLAEDVESDIDMPPFDRSAMDGYAILGAGPRFNILPPILAGDGKARVIEEGQAAPIMTGAPVPGGADRVVIVETASVDGEQVQFSSDPGPGGNICRQGEDIRKGDRVLYEGTRLEPHHLGIAAMAGFDTLPVYGKPGVAVMTTGSEIIPPASSPRPGQVRNANLILMYSLVRGAGFRVPLHVHTPDEPGLLADSMGQALEAADLLLVAGGVSMGTHDFVPGVMKDLGIDLKFRSVAQKPGKPLTFGVSSDGKPVFGLPGNPVSVLICIEEYVIPCLRRIAGFRSYRKREFNGKLLDLHLQKRGRTNFLRVNASVSGSGWKLRIPATSGSGDLMSTRDVNALAISDAGRTSVAAGESLPFHLLSAFGGELAFE